MRDHVHYVYFSTLDSHMVLYTSHLDIPYIDICLNLKQFKENFCPYTIADF
jgi:hypothetical protein